MRRPFLSYYEVLAAGVMTPGFEDAGLRWFETDPWYVFHLLNAYDDGARVVVDVARYPRLPLPHRVPNGFHGDFRNLGA